MRHKLTITLHWDRLAGMICIGPNVGSLIGSDSTVHLSEELKNASRRLPRIMIISAILNYALGFLILLTFLFHLGNLEDVLHTEYGQPYIEVVLNATHSTDYTVAVVAIVAILTTACAVNTVTTCSRQLWSYARDGKLEGYSQTQCAAAEC